MTPWRTRVSYSATTSVRLEKSRRPTRRPAHSPQRRPTTAPEMQHRGPLRTEALGQPGQLLGRDDPPILLLDRRQLDIAAWGPNKAVIVNCGREDGAHHVVRRTVHGDAAFVQALTRCWMSHGLTEASLREPSAGKRWLCSTDSSRARLDGRLDGSRANHSPARSRNVRDERRGSTQPPRLRSASSRASKVSASFRVRNVRLYGRPSGARRRTSHVIHHATLWSCGGRCSQFSAPSRCPA
jgi:hypothetical protein